MVFVQVDIPCLNDRELCKWMNIADGNDYFLEYHGYELSIKAHNVTEEEALRLKNLVDCYPVHSVFMYETMD